MQLASEREPLRETSETSELAIVDGQAYVASADFLPPSFAEGIKQNLRLRMSAQGLDVPPNRLHDICMAQLDDPWCDELVRQMDEAKISQSVLMLPDFTYLFPKMTLTIAEMIDRHQSILERHPGRFYVMLGVDPRWGRDGIALFEKAIRQYGFHGLKVYPPCGYSPSDEALFPYYEICRGEGIPVSLHTGGTTSALRLDLSYPRLADEALRSFPEVNFILAHASSCYTDECTMLCSVRPNVFLDVSGFAAQPLRRLRPLFECGISHKLVFGTDWPSFRANGRQVHLLRLMYDDDGPVAHMRSFETRRFFGEAMTSLLPSPRSRVRAGAVAARERG